MSFIKNLDRDEMRSGFLVKSSTKRLWNAQIGLLMEFARICEKYQLRWFAMYGTLLGAVRHQGFIPWDSDIDLMMSRPDYEKFKQIAPFEIRYPYYFDLWYENQESPNDPPEAWPLLPFIKLRDLRTASIEWESRTQLHQYIAIDIFPLDSFPPFDNEQLELKFRAIYELYFTACHTQFIRDELAHPTGEFMLGRDRIQKIYDLPLKTRGMLLEEKTAEFYCDSKYVSMFIYLSKHTLLIYERSWFDEIIYLPFEKISIPAPKEFDKILTVDYDDWHKVKCFGVPTQQFSINIPYDKLLEERIAPDNLAERSNSLRIRFNDDEFRNGIFVSVSMKKCWKIQIELIEELKRICEILNLKFWATGTTLFAAYKFHGFNPEDVSVTFEMTREDFEKLHFDFPYRLYETRLMDERTMMVFKLASENIPQGIFIDILSTDNPPDEIESIPFEFTSIPVPKNYMDILRESFDDLENVHIKRALNGIMSSDISYEEFFSKFKRAILINSGEFIDLEYSGD